MLILGEQGEEVEWQEVSFLLQSRIHFWCEQSIDDFMSPGIKGSQAYNVQGTNAYISRSLH